MKNSIAKQISIRVLLILFASLTILYTVLAIFIYNGELEKKGKYAKAIAFIYTDTVVMESAKYSLPVDLKNVEISNFYGEYLCEWYDIDYTSIYIPDFENNKITYISASEKLAHEEKTINEDISGVSFDYELTSEEKDVWEGKSDYAFLKRKTNLGVLNSCIVRLVDVNNNMALVSIDINSSRFVSEFLTYAFLIFALLIFVMLAIYISVYITIKKMVQKPAHEISEKMQKYITDGKRTTEALENNYYAEFATIADSFNKMNNDIDSYLKNISELTRESEHNKTETSIAGKIQLGFLEKNKLYADKYIIDAYIKPAKNIGGDFYDYLRIDNNRLFFSIIDVSGKGIIASITLNILFSYFNHYALLNKSPSEIIEITNNELFAKNKEMQFATAFIGIYDPSTCDLTYCNAGHNIPYLISNNKLRKLDESRGTIIGLFKNEKYPETTIKLNNNDIIFMYTDGVTEAVNNKNEFYGEEKLEQALNDLQSTQYKHLTEHIISSVNEFSKDAEQHDDITMLSIKFSDHFEMDLELKIENLSIIKETIMNLNIPKNDRLDLCVAAEECFVNITSYAFPDGIPENEFVHYTLNRLDNKVSIAFIDNGVPFDPTKNVINIDNYDIDNEIGGLGNYIMSSIVDDMNYHYENNSNILTLNKYIKNQGEYKNGDK